MPAARRVIALAVLLLGCGTRSGLSIGSEGDASAASFDSAVDCRPQDATGYQNKCFQIIGYRWDGSRCVVVGGCACNGADCDSLAEDEDVCIEAHRGCR